MRTRLVLYGRNRLVAFALSLAAPAASADPAAVIDRCEKLMGTHGAAMVKACVDRDLAAARALASYPDSSRKAVARCEKAMGSHGAAMVKACADRDIEAARALDQMRRR